jgi:hypothetical protein
MTRLSALGGVALCAMLFGASEARAACMGRPTDSGGFQGYDYGDVETKSHATSQVRVHWATSGTHAPVLFSTRDDGVPDTVAFAADTAEDALTRYAEMGYRKVPSDGACTSNGGDDKLDIYLVRFVGADGSTIPECEGTSCSSFALVESTFRGKGYASPQEGFRTVVTHELFHAVQNTYKRGDAPFWAEGTAQWAMKTLHPELQDFERQLPAFFSDTTRSIDAAPSGVTAGFLYGSAVWPLFVALTHGPETIREIFELEGGGQDVLAATDAVLQQKGSSLGDAFPLFGAWNAGTGKIASQGGYPDAAKYPGTKVGALADGVSGITSGMSYFAYRGTLDAKLEVAFEGDAARNGGVVVPFESGVLRLDRAQKLPADAEGEVLVVVSGTTTKKTDAPFRIRLNPPGASTSSTSTSSSSATSSDEGCRVAPGPSSRGRGWGLACVGGAALLGLRSRGRSRSRR